MNTKNIFRILFMAVLLLVGANSAKAEVLYEKSGGSGNYEYITIPFGAFDNYKGGTLRITYDLLAGDTHSIQIGNITNVSVTAGGVYEMALDNSFYEKINTTDQYNASLFIQPANVTIYKIEAISAGGGTGEDNKTYKVEVQDEIANYSQVTISPEEPKEKENVTLTFEPKDGYKLTSVRVQTTNKQDVTVEKIGENKYQFKMPASDVTVSAEFKPIYEISVSDTSNGTVEVADSKAAEGETVTLFVSPDKGYELESILAVDRDGYIPLYGSGNMYTFTMRTSDVTISATFEPVYDILISSDITNGTVTADFDYAKEYEIVTLTITPDYTYDLESISVLDGYDNIVSLSGSGNTRTFTMPASKVTVSATFKKLTPVKASVSDAGYATFCSEKALDFSRATKLTAYYAADAATNPGYVKLERVTGTVAAGTGLIIKSISGNREEEEIPAVASGNAIADNLLKGVTSLTSIGKRNYYVLTIEDGEVKFASTEYKSATVEAGHAYLDLSGSSSRGYDRLQVIFSDETTGIEDAMTQDNQEEVYYDLRGMRVTKPTHGIYIVNGKKVFVK